MATLRTLLALMLKLHVAMVCAQQVTTFGTIPGRTPSDKYVCRVRQVCNAAWQNDFTLQTYSQAPAAGNGDGYVGHLNNWSASWIAFEFAGTEVVVEIAKADGTPIQSAMVRPVGKTSAAVIENGKVYVTFSSPTRSPHR